MPPTTATSLILFHPGDVAEDARELTDEDVFEYKPREPVMPRPMKNDDFLDTPPVVKIVEPRNNQVFFNRH